MLKSGKVMGGRAFAPHKQRGVVLLIALIILVAMTLAGIGMMRSVDTGNIIAGNLAFRQATDNANVQGTNAGFGQFTSIAASVNGQDRTLLYLDGDNTQACPVGTTPLLCAAGSNFSLKGLGGVGVAYYSKPLAACEVDLTCTGQEYNWWRVSSNWNGAPSVPVYMNPAIPSANTVLANVSYLIHRMCTNANSPPTQHTCQWQPEPGCNRQLGACNDMVLYRITARAVGSRNTVSYSQTLVLNPEYVAP